MRLGLAASALCLSIFCATGLAAANAVAGQADDFARGFMEDDAEHIVVVARLERQEYLGSLSDDDQPDAIIMDGVIRGQFRLRHVVAGAWSNRTFRANFVAHSYFSGRPMLILLINKKQDGQHTIRAYGGVSRGTGCLPEDLLVRYGLTVHFPLQSPDGQKELCAKI